MGIKWQIVDKDGLPKNNGNGVSDLCLVYSIDASSETSRYVFCEDDETGEDCSHWDCIPENRQHRVKIWAYLPLPGQRVFDEAVECMKAKRKNKA